MSEPSVKRRNKEAEEGLAKEYRDIGIKAVAAAVEPTDEQGSGNRKARPPNPIGRATNE
jgi:hypothetical protein